MTAPANALFVGHRHLRRLLAMLDRQADAFQRGRTPDVALMRDVIDCLNRYVEAGEGKLVDQMALENDRFAPARVVLTTEHQILVGLGEHCLTVLDDVIDGQIVARATLTNPTRRLIRLFRAHLAREHGYVRRYQPGCLAGVQNGSRRTVREHRASMEILGDLRDRIRQAAAKTHKGLSGALVCPACDIETGSRA